VLLFLLAAFLFILLSVLVPPSLIVTLPLIAVVIVLKLLASAGKLAFGKRRR
jgi:hypothetical protein